MRAAPATGSTSINFPLYTNTFIAGTTIVIDRPGTENYCNVLNNFLTFTQECDAGSPFPYSGYMRLDGLSTINMKTIAWVSVLQNYGSGAVPPIWTAAEVKHFGVAIYNTDPDNNYLLMISPAASAVGERSVQLVKQVATIETLLDSDIVAGLLLNTEYRLELERVAGVLTGQVFDSSGNLLSTVSASDTDLSSGNSGAHGFSAAYTVRDMKVQ